MISLLNSGWTVILTQALMETLIEIALEITFEKLSSFITSGLLLAILFIYLSCNSLSEILPSKTTVAMMVIM